MSFLSHEAFFFQISVDPANPDVGIKEALLKARESEAIAKYLGTSESKIRAGVPRRLTHLSWLYR